METNGTPRGLTIKEAKAQLADLGYVFRDRTPKERALYSIVGLLAFVGWLTLFVLGCWIDTGPSRDWLVNEGFNGCHVMKILFCWTPTNVAWLGLFSALGAGCLSFNTDPSTLKANMVKAMIQNDNSTLDRLQRQMEFLYELPWVSMKRSFAVYLLAIASTYLLDVSPFAVPPRTDAKEIADAIATAQEKYVHLAAIISALSFVMGFDPTRFQGLIERIGGWTASPRFDLPSGRDQAQAGKAGVPLPPPQLPGDPQALHTDPQPPAPTPPGTPMIPDIPAFKLD